MANLHPLDRRRAERWLAEVGEARFLTIALAAVSDKRPNHRPAKDTTAIVQRAVLYWLTHPGMSEGQAAAAAARELCATPRPGMPTVGRVQRIMSGGLKKRTVRCLRKALEEAQRLGLPIRADAVPPYVPHCIVSPEGPSPTVRLPSTRTPSSLERTAKTEADFLASTNVLSPVQRSPAMLAKLEREGHLLAALDGLVPDDTPMSDVTATFAEMVAALQKPEH